MTPPDKKRWYDGNDRTSVAVQLIIKLPPAFQEIVCRGVTTIAEQEFRANELLENLRTLGADKVLSMFKSKKKQRGYDAQNFTHKTLNYLSLLSEENRNLMATHIFSLMEIVQEYLKLCQNYRETPKSERLGELTDTYAYKGREAARLLLSNFEKALIQKLSPGSQAPSPEKSKQERIEDRGQDMKISDDQRS